MSVVDTSTVLIQSKYPAGSYVVSMTITEGTRVNLYQLFGKRNLELIESQDKYYVFRFFLTEESNTIGIQSISTTPVVLSSIKISYRKF